jgi:hypothetical protein
MADDEAQIRPVHKKLPYCSDTLSDKRLERFTTICPDSSRLRNHFKKEGRWKETKKRKKITKGRQKSNDKLEFISFAMSSYTALNMLGRPL